MLQMQLNCLVIHKLVDFILAAIIFKKCAIFRIVYFMDLKRGQHAFCFQRILSVAR